MIENLNPPADIKLVMDIVSQMSDFDQKGFYGRVINNLSTYQDYQIPCAARNYEVDPEIQKRIAVTLVSDFMNFGVMGPGIIPERFLNKNHGQVLVNNLQNFRNGALTL